MAGRSSVLTVQGDQSSRGVLDPHYAVAPLAHLPASPPNPREANMAQKQGETPISKITVGEFAEVTFSSVLRALEARDRKRPFGPILYGIIAWPDGFGFPEFVGPGGIGEREGVSRSGG
jgi:hypothetical protein